MLWGQHGYRQNVCQATPGESGVSENTGHNPATALTLRAFFEGHPPGKGVYVDLGMPERVNGNGAPMVQLPDITLYCTEEPCKGPRLFSSRSPFKFDLEYVANRFVEYTCRNCGEGSKTFALMASFSDDLFKPIVLQKYGELPAFGPPTPARVTTLLGSERDYYLKGRRAESQSMGVAAFAYYRRVVENKKAEIIDEVIRVSRLLNAGPELLAELDRAKSETQFTKAVETVKHGIPQVLYISGHNPLTLLHAALSEGLHAQTDEECLELAASIRVVLTEFVERVAVALKDEKELAGAVSRLMQVKGRAQAAK